MNKIQEVMGFKINQTDFLEHHGVKNQKWGERRYQYQDGSLTPLGRIHYGVGEKRKAKQEAKRQAKALKDELYKEKIRKKNEAIIEKEKAKIRKKFGEKTETKKPKEETPSDYHRYLMDKKNKKLMWHNTQKISDADLISAVNRLRLEDQYNSYMNSKWKSKSKIRIEKLRAMSKSVDSFASNKNVQKMVGSLTKFLSSKIKSVASDHNDTPFYESPQKTTKKVKKEKVKKEKRKKDKNTNRTREESIREDPMVEIITPSSAKDTTTSIINSFTPEYSFSTASPYSYSAGYDYVTKLLT